MNARPFSAALCGAAIGLTIIAETSLPVRGNNNLDSSKSNMYRPIATTADTEAPMLALLFGASNIVVAAGKAATPAAETVHLYLKMTGKVIRDNQSGKTFTVMAGGKEVTFSAAKLKVLPKVGEIIDITYTESPGGPMEAITINSTKSNTF